MIEGTIYGAVGSNRCLNLNTIIGNMCYVCIDISTTHSHNVMVHASTATQSMYNDSTKNTLFFFLHASSAINNVAIQRRILFFPTSLCVHLTFYSFALFDAMWDTLKEINLSKIDNFVGVAVLFYVDDLSWWRLLSFSVQNPR